MKFKFGGLSLGDDPNTDGLHRLIIRGAAASMGVRIVGVGLSYATNVLLSRLLGLAGYGQYVIVLSWVLVLVLPARAGIDNSALRYSSVYLDRGAAAQLRGFARFASATVILFSIIIGGLTVWLGPRLISPDRNTVLWGAATIFPIAWIGVHSVFMRTARKIVAAQFYEQVLRPSLVMAGLAAAAVAGFGIDAASAMFVTAVAAYATLLALLFHFRREFRHTRSHAPDYAEWRQWLLVSLPMLMMGVFQELLNQVDIIFLGLIANAREAALFAASWRLASLVPFALIALGTLAGPLIAAAFDRRDYDEMHRVSRLTARLGFVFALLSSFALVLGGRWLLGIFGHEFTGGYVVLCVLLVGGVVNAYTGVVAYMMTMTGHERQIVYIFAGALVLSGALNLLLIPRFGAIGAAVASSSGLAAYNIAMLIYVRRVLGIDASALARPPRLTT